MGSVVDRNCRPVAAMDGRHIHVHTALLPADPHWLLHGGREEDTQGAAGHHQHRKNNNNNNNNKHIIITLFARMQEIFPEKGRGQRRLLVRPGVQCGISR